MSISSSLLFSSRSCCIFQLAVIFSLLARNSRCWGWCPLHTASTELRSTRIRRRSDAATMWGPTARHLLVGRDPAWRRWRMPRTLGFSSLNGDVPQGSSAPSSQRPSSTSSPTSLSQRLPRIPPNVHRVVMMRHGESEFNNANIFTGWCDVALTPRGLVEAVEAGEVFRAYELTFRKCYTSLLTRSIVTSHRTLEAAGVAYTPLQYDWRLNERHYGALQGLSKERTAERLGRALVMNWRRSFAGRPPLMTPEHPHYEIINRDPRYRLLPDIPLGESLQDCQERVVLAWQDIVKDIAGHSPSSTGGATNLPDSDYSLLVGHANTLRALAMHLDEIPATQIEGLNIPTAIPFYYDIDKTTGQVVSVPPIAAEDGAGALGRFRGIYIADERKKRNFLERRRAANDPWLWALHDHQVARSMLVDDGTQDDDDEINNNNKIDDLGKESGKQAPEEATILNRIQNPPQEVMKDIEEEAKHNTEVFAAGVMKEQHTL